MHRWQQLAEDLLAGRGAELVAHAALLADHDEDADALVMAAVENVVSRRRLPGDLDTADAEARFAMAVAVARPGWDWRQQVRGPEAVHSTPTKTIDWGVDQQPADAEAADEDIAERRQRSRAVRESLRALAPLPRACVVLRHVDGLSVTRIAGLLDVDTDQVRAALASSVDVAHTLGVAAPGPELETVDVTPGRSRR